MEGARTSGGKLRLFISYSRCDAEAADLFVSRLPTDAFEVAIDRRDLPYGEEWQAEIGEFIRGCDTVVWLVSPDSVASRWVNWELGEVVRLHKRLLPVCIRPTNPASLPEALGKLHVLPATGQYDPDEHLTALIDTLNTDRAWVRHGSRLADRAHEWLGRQRDRGLLLRGAALKAAEIWSTLTPPSAPRPHGEILELILASRRDRTRRQRWTVGVSLGSAVIGIALAVTAFVFQQRADKSAAAALVERDRATRNEREALDRRNEALIGQSRFLADLAQQKTRDGDAVAGVLLALEALPGEGSSQPMRPYVAEAERSLNAAVREVRERAILNGRFADSIVNVGGYLKEYVSGLPSSATPFSKDGRRIAMFSSAGVEVRDSQSGALIRRIAVPVGDLRAVAFSSDGRRLMAEQSGGVRVWLAETAAEIGMFGGLRGEGGVQTHPLISPDGRRIATFAADLTVEVWDAETKARIATFRRPAATHLSASFSPDNRRIMIVGWDKKAWLWNAETGAKLTEISWQAGYDWLFSPDGKRLLMPWNLVQLRLLDGLTGKEIRTIDVDIVETSDDALPAFTPDGQRLLTTADDDGLHLWDAATGVRIATLAGRFMRIDPTGSRIVTQADGNLVFWRTADGRRLTTLSGLEKDYGTVVFSSDGRKLLSAHGPKVRLWDAVGGTEIAEFLHEGVFSTALSPSGAVAMTVGGNEIRLWDAASDAPIAVLKGHGDVQTAMFTPDGRRVVVVYDDETTRLWSVYPDTDLLSLQSPKAIEGAAFSRDGGQLAVAVRDATIRIWSAANGATIATLSGHKAAVTSSTFSPDGTSLLSASEDKSSILWDLKTNAPAWTLSGHSVPVVAAEFSPNGREIATADSYGHVFIWDAAAQVLKTELNGPVGLRALAWRPGGQQLLGASVYEVDAWVWDILRKEKVRTFAGHKKGINAAAWSTDGAYVVTGSQDHTARVWRADTGVEIAVLIGHSNVIGGVAFSPNGRLVVTASYDGTVRAWKASTGEEVAVLRGFGVNTSINSVAFSGDGHRILTASRGGAIRIDRLDQNLDDLVGFAISLMPRCFSAAERHAYYLAGDGPAWCSRFQSR